MAGGFPSHESRPANLNYELVKHMCERLSDEQVSELYAAFVLLDGDSDGRIDAADFQNFLQTFGYHFSLQEVEDWISEETVQVSNFLEQMLFSHLFTAFFQPAGVLDFPEFITMLNRLVSSSSRAPIQIDDDNLQEVWACMACMQTSGVTLLSFYIGIRHVGFRWRWKDNCQ
jgi:Ca2+-binding EF-hand superfamily protein